MQRMVGEVAGVETLGQGRFRRGVRGRGLGSGGRRERRRVLPAGEEEGERDGSGMGAGWERDGVSEHTVGAGRWW